MKTQRFSRQYWLKLVRFTLVAATLALCSLTAMLVQQQIEALLVAVRKPITETPATLGLPYEDVSLTSRDGLNIAAWFIPGSRPNAIILVHGIHANRQALLPTAEFLAEAGYPLLMLDLRGHGESDDGELTYGYREALDVQAGVDYLAGRPDIDKIGVLGTSYGGAAVVRAAAIEPRLAAVVVQHSFSSLEAAIDDAFDNMAVLPRWPFAPIVVWLAEQRVGVQVEQISSVRDLPTIAPRPVLIIHADNDGMFPLHHGQAMFEAAGEPKRLWIVPGAGHGDPATTHQDLYKAQLLDFFEEAFAGP